MNDSCPIRRRSKRLLVLGFALAASQPLPLMALDALFVKQIIAGIERNYEQIGSVRASIQEHSRDNSVEGEKEVKTYRRPNSSMVVTSYADLWATIDFVGRGGDYRRTWRPSHNENWEIIAKKAGVWTFYSERNGVSRANIWNRDQLPGKSPIDPREFPCDGLTERLVDVLREHTTVSINRISHDGEHSLIRVVTRREPGATERTWEFDPELGFMPIRRFNSWPDDDSLLQVVVISYRTVLGGKARYPVKMVRRFYDKGVAKDLDSPNWRQQHEWLVTKLDVADLHGANVTAKDMQIEFRPRTTVNDAIRRKSYVVGEDD